MRRRGDEVLNDPPAPTARVVTSRSRNSLSARTIQRRAGPRQLPLPRPAPTSGHFGRRATSDTAAPGPARHAVLGGAGRGPGVSRRLPRPPSPQARPRRLAPAVGPTPDGGGSVLHPYFMAWWARPASLSPAGVSRVGGSPWPQPHLSRWPSSPTRSA